MEQGRTTPRVAALARHIGHFIRPVGPERFAGDGSEAVQIRRLVFGW